MFYLVLLAYVLVVLSMMGAAGRYAVLYRREPKPTAKLVLLSAYIHGVSGVLALCALVYLAWMISILLAVLSETPR